MSDHNLAGQIKISADQSTKNILDSLSKGLSDLRPSWTSDLADKKEISVLFDDVNQSIAKLRTFFNTSLNEVADDIVDKCKFEKPSWASDLPSQTDLESIASKIVDPISTEFGVLKDGLKNLDALSDQIKLESEKILSTFIEKQAGLLKRSLVDLNSGDEGFPIPETDNPNLLLASDYLTKIVKHLIVEVNSHTSDQIRTAKSEIDLAVNSTVSKCQEDLGAVLLLLQEQYATLKWLKKPWYKRIFSKP
jgi:hypothetical protein